VAAIARQIVAVLNSSPDVMTMLREALEEEGFTIVTAHVPEIKRGQQDLVAFLTQHDPRVIVYDISPPYDENWTFLRLVQDTESVKNRAFVLTTINKRALEEAVGATHTLEVIGKPYDLGQVVRAVQKACG
jgi:CheY-like chemotaxis protein